MKITPELLRPFLLHRQNDSHKHQYGHALIVAGCSSMPGAAVMATGAALHSGCGLVTLHSSSNACLATASRYPSAMLSSYNDDFLPEGLSRENLERYSVIAIGPGLGCNPATEASFYKLFHSASGKAGEESIPMVLDADALNIMAKHINQYYDYIPKGSVLTPHEGELGRLYQGREDIEDMLISEYCRMHQSTLVRKGYHTRVYGPDGVIYENTTGNPGMAKGGSGDVLTGLIAGLIARGYTCLQAALLGVWIHGYAGDRLSEDMTQECYCAQQLIDYLHEGFAALY